MSSALKILIAAVVGGAVVAACLSYAVGTQMSTEELTFWVIVTLVASAFPVHIPRGPVISVSIMPILAAAILGGPLAGAATAGLGTIEVRELRGKVPWYGVLYNHAASVLPAVFAAIVLQQIIGTSSDPSILSLVAVLMAAITYFVVNNGLSSLAIGLRDHRSIGQLFLFDVRTFGASLVGLSSLAWMMAIAYPALGPLVVLPFALPLYTTRSAYHMVVEIREMFTQTIRTLATAIDARDPSTQNHSKYVSDIAVDIGSVMGCSEAELEQLQWGGLLHDIGKIGIRDNILLKEDRLTQDERTKMNAHPIMGEEIIKPVKKLGPELPLIRHHHEWFNGSGYPDRLVGHEIPKLARILHVADAFEAMTASRPYRKKPLSTQQAIDELRRFSGVQFDPDVVEAFMRTRWAREERDGSRLNSTRLTSQRGRLPATRQPVAQHSASSSKGFTGPALDQTGG